jgi:hypothetical protein
VDEQGERGGAAEGEEGGEDGVAEQLPLEPADAVPALGREPGGAIDEVD